MYNSTQAYIDAMKGEILDTHIKMELMDKNENVLDEISMSATEATGDITVDGNREIRRMFTLTLDNRDGKFTWGVGKLIWMDLKRVKLSTGLRLGNGSIEYIPQGVFILTEPEAKSLPHENTVTLSGQDKWYLLTGNLGRFTHETTINKGTNIKEAVKIIAKNAGIPENKMILDDCDITVPYDMTFQIGQNRGKALKDLTEKAYDQTDNSFYDIFFDVEGFLRFAKYNDPLKQAPCWSYKVEDGTLYAGSVRKLDDTEIFNHILVMGGSSNTAEFRSEIIIDKTLEEWKDHPYSIQDIGDRMYVWNNGNPDSNIDTQSQCDARADFEIKKRLKYTEKVSLNLAPNYLHDANDVIEIVDVQNGTTGQYQLKQFTVPIKPKIITCEAYKIVDGSKK